MAILNKPTGLNILWASTGVKTSPDTAKINLGWVVEIPPFQYQNWLDNRQDAFIAHTNQHGIPVWDAETEYQGGLSYTKGSDGIVYKCLSTGINFNPTDPLNRSRWAVAFETFGSVAIVQAALTQHLSNYASLSGITNIVAARNNLSVYSKAETDAGFAARAGSSAQLFSVATPTAINHAVSLGYLNSRLTVATETTPGTLSIATVQQAESGVSAPLAITPSVGQTVYIKKSSNLAGLANLAQSRNNLGLGDIATQPIARFLMKEDNLAGLTNLATARNNLGLGSSAVQPATAFLLSSRNLGDVDRIVARNNLGLTTMATMQQELVMFKESNLQGLTNVAVARDNLGLGTIAVQSAASYMAKAENLAGLTNVQAARNNLGLGPAAIMSAFGIESGLDFSANLDFNGYQKLPSGLLIQWGVAQVVPADGDVTIRFPIPFRTTGFIGMAGHVGTSYNRTTDALASFTFVDRSLAILSNGYGYSSVSMYWFAIGY